MPAFSAFTPFGALRFSSRPSHGEQIYREMVKSLGSGKNYSDDFDSLAMARVYANAMVFGACKYSIERAGNQFRPSRALELLPALEAEYGVIPDPSATISERRSELAVAMRVARGAKRSNVEAVMTELFGADFVEYFTVPVADAETTTGSFTDFGVYVKPGTPRVVFRLRHPIFDLGSPITTTADLVAGTPRAFEPNTRIIVDPGDYGRCEAVTLASSTYDTDLRRLTFTTTFARPHNTGRLIATGRHPNVATSKRHNVFVMTSEAVRDNRTRRRLDAAARRLLRGVSTWSTTDGSGPFKVGVGRLGVTTIGEVP